MDNANEEHVSEEYIDEDDRIQLPPGWGPIVFLAAVILLSNLGLGLWMRSMTLNQATSAVAAAPGMGGPGMQGGGPGMQGGGPGMQGGKGAKQGGPGMQGGMGGKGAKQGGLGMQGGGQQGGPGIQGGMAAAGELGAVMTVDESEFTPELDAKLRAAAEKSGLDPDTVPSAKQIFQQMERSNLLPRNGDVDLETMLVGHIVELARSGTGFPEGGIGQPVEGAVDQPLDEPEKAPAGE